MVFRVSAKADTGDFAEGDNAGLAWDILRKAGDHTLPSTVDLSQCPHLKPYSIACLCALGELAKRDGRTINAIPPTDAKCADHLVRIGLPSYLEGEWTHSDVRSTNFSARTVGWPPGNEGDEIVELLVNHTELSAGLLPRIKDRVDEVIANAVTHAESPIDCIVAGQAFPATEKLEIAILDLGQTIKGHLTKNPEHRGVTSDEDAIFLAMKEGVTGTPPGSRNRRGGINSGAGLFDLRQYCESGGGELTILSGDRWVTCGPSHSPVTGKLYRRFRGCLVNVRFFLGFDLPHCETEPIL